MSAVLSLKGVAFTKEQQPGIDLNLPLSSWGQIVGPPNSGKTRLLSMVARVQSPASGTVRIFGQSLSDASVKQKEALRQRVAYVEQGRAPIAYLSIYDNLALPLRLHRMEEKTVKQYCRQLCAWLKFERAHERLASSLSFSEARLLTLAQAIIRQPELLILDDPFASLYDHDQARMKFLLKELCPAGMTVLISGWRVVSDDTGDDKKTRPIVRLTRASGA